MGREEREGRSCRHVEVARDVVQGLGENSRRKKTGEEAADQTIGTFLPWGEIQAQSAAVGRENLAAF